ncbi:MAG: hypothetical protein H7Y11_14520 [Armatimonadetes bacterium]|nr:hypothetical protein [Anaerolineae bacterium]
MLDDLRKSASDDFDDNGGFSGDEDFDYDGDPDSGGRSERFLGMTAVERMFISIFLFLNVCVIGIALLLVTGRIQL